MWTIKNPWVRSSRHQTTQQAQALANTASVAFEALEARQLLSVVSIADAAASEGGILTFPVTLDAPATAPITLKFNTAAKTAKFNKNFIKNNGTLTFNIGDTTQNITVNTIDDTIFASAKTMTVHLSAAGKGNKIARATATGTINNIDAPPNITINNISVPEPAKKGKTATGKFVITLSGNHSEKPVVVTFATADGTATAGQDYVPILHGKATFAGKKTAATVPVKIKFDSTNTTDEAFNLDLTGVTNGALSTTAGTCTITFGVTQPPPTDGLAAKFNAATFNWTSHGNPRSDMVANFSITNTGTVDLSGAQVQYFFVPQGSDLTTATPFQSSSVTTLAVGQTFNSGDVAVNASSVTTTPGFYQFVARLVDNGQVLDTNFGPILQV